MKSKKQTNIDNFVADLVRIGAHVDTDAESGARIVRWLVLTGQHKDRPAAIVIPARLPRGPLNWTPYGSAELREAGIARQLDTYRREARERAERNAPHPLNVGDILVSSWGYEQTNVDFYQVTAATARTVTIRSIGQRQEYTSDMTGRAYPIADSFKGSPMVKRANGRGEVTIATFAYARPWDGRPASWTAYA